MHSSAPPWIFFFVAEKRQQKKKYVNDYVVVENKQPEWNGTTRTI